MLLSLIIIVSGIVFAYRISSSIVDRHHLLSRTTMTKIGTVYLAVLASTYLVSPRAHAMLWMIAYAPQASFALAMVALRAMRTHAFRSRFADSLTRIILKMRAGHAFRHAFTDTIAEAEPHLRAKLTEIRDLVVFSQQTKGSPASAFAREIVSEFRIADQLPHAALKRLETFRERICCEDDFRRRSGQVMKQIRVQSLLLAGLYVAVLAFVCRSFDVRDNARLLFGSILLFIAGLSWIWLGGRNLKWKV